MTKEKNTGQEKEAGLIDIFSVFAKIGTFTIGGGYAMIPIIQNELSKRGWLTDEELPNIIALAQSAPGVLTVNVAIFTGHRLKGLKGSIAAATGTILPSFFIILCIAALFTGYQDNPAVIRIFKGIRPVVISLIAAPMIKMAKKNNKSWWAWTISAVTLGLVSFLNISPIYILIVIIVLSFTLVTIRERKGGKI